MLWNKVERIALALTVIGGFLAVIQFSSKDSFPVIRDVSVNSCDENETTNGESAFLTSLLRHDMEIVYLKHVELKTLNCETGYPSWTTEFTLSGNISTQKLYPLGFNFAYVSMPDEESSAYVKIYKKEGRTYSITGPVRVLSTWGEGDLYLKLVNVDVEKGLYNYYYCAKKKANFHPLLASIACLF